MKIRTGFGYDIHQLEEGRDFWLGGIKISEELGAVGHSDADVLIHAICDAMLGAANLRDIGYHFSDQDPAFKGIDSKILLERCNNLLEEKGWKIGNIDSTVVLEAPKVNPHIPEMTEVMCQILNLDKDCLSIKATTSEKMSFVGRGDGVKAYASVLIEEIL
jgi:2-C-methyl-D-erythritol 2,4-cyclodiphosphate synthase